jgi:hypothetical protein
LNDLRDIRIGLMRMLRSKDKRFGLFYSTFVGTASHIHPFHERKDITKIACFSRNFFMHELKIFFQEIGVGVSTACIKKLIKFIISR